MTESHITHEMGEQVADLREFMSRHRGQIMTVSHTDRIDGELQRIVEIHVPISLIRYAKPWRVLWGMVKAIYRAWDGFYE